MRARARYIWSVNVGQVKLEEEGKETRMNVRLGLAQLDVFTKET